MDIEEVAIGSEASPCATSTVVVAVNGSKNSRNALKWALDKFIPEGRTCFRLLYVRPKITMVPTPMGNYIPISNVREDVASAYKKEVEWQTTSMFLPYKKMCAQRKVEAESMVIEGDDVAAEISGDVAKFSFNKLVIGASSRNIFTRRSTGNSMSSKISRCIPIFCTVYVVSKGKLSSVRASTLGTDKRSNYDSISITSSSTESECGDPDSSASSSISYTPSQLDQLMTINNNFVSKRSNSVDTHHTSTSVSLSNDKDATSLSSMSESQSKCDSDLSSNNCKDYSPSGHEVYINEDLKKLRIELKRLDRLCEIARSETITASIQLNELSVARAEETSKLEGIRLREEKATEAVDLERERREEMEREAELVRECAEREASLRKDAEEATTREPNEKARLEKVFECNSEQYMRYTWDEIKSATSSFSDTLKIGSGANGVVYRCTLHHTVAAVKLLHSNEAHATKQFKQELEILIRIRHPHLILLLGACPDRGCLVYEYMENGSLDDRLQCKDNTPPLPWYHRFRISWEIASALVFLHNTKPGPIVHRDLKPANILLDRNHMSKISDVGISTLIPPTPSLSMSTIYKETAPVGTYFYIDPEYQRTGLISPKSDTYALGIVILQLLTSRPPMGLTYVVETAVEEGHLADVLDSGAGEWPMDEAKELALIGLSCSELRRKDRPELKDEVLPTLERLKEFADKVRDSVHRPPSSPPDHFICPILMEVMDDPCVASDGYTYDRSAITGWLSTNNKSPMTNLQMPNKVLVPNMSLLSAIKEWKSRTQ